MSRETRSMHTSAMPPNITNHGLTGGQRDLFMLGLFCEIGTVALASEGRPE